MAMVGVPASGPSGAPGSASPIQGAIGNIWKIEIRGAYPDNVATSTSWFYRQTTEFNAADNVAQKLFDAFAAGPASPLEVWRNFCSNQFSFECAIVTNQSIPNSLSQVFTITGGEGQVAGEFISTQIVVRQILMTVDGQPRARKSMYLPGIANSQVTDSKITEASLGGIATFVDSQYSIPSIGEEFEWVYGNYENAWQLTANAHIACFVTRLYSRNAQLC